MLSATLAAQGLRKSRQRRDPWPTREPGWECKSAGKL